MLSAESTKVLILRAGNGDEAALDLLLQKYRPFLRIMAQREICQRFQARFDASDAVQHTCWEATKGIDGFRGSGEMQFNAWIKRILANSIICLEREHLAKKRDVRRDRLDLIPKSDEFSLRWFAADPRTGPQSKIVKGEAALVLTHALSKLTSTERTVVELRFLEGCKIKDIADFLEMSESSTARSIARGLAELRKHLPNEFGELN